MSRHLNFTDSLYKKSILMLYGPFHRGYLDLYVAKIGAIVAGAVWPDT